MALPTSFTDLSTTAASNYPASSDNIAPSLDDLLRLYGACLASIMANSGNSWTSPYSTAANPVFTGVASFPDGAEATPSITNTGDLNTGIWFPAADTVAASTAGTERLRIDSSGNVGIGVTPSGEKFQVVGNVRIQDAASETNAGRLFVTGALVGLETRYATPLTFGTSATERMRIDASGNLIHAVTGTAPTLGTNSTMSFELTSDTSLKIVVRGSDGVTRSASLTLA